MKQKRAKIGFTGCAKAYIRSLQEEGRYSTAHVYKNAVLSFTRFHGVRILHSSRSLASLCDVTDNICTIAN